jgi:hypothetical protein
MGLDVFRLQLQRPAVRLNRFRDPAKPVKGDCQLAMRPGMIRIETHKPLITGDRLKKAPQILAHAPQPKDRRCVIGLRLKNSAVSIRGLDEFSRSMGVLRRLKGLSGGHRSIFSQASATLNQYRGSGQAASNVCRRLEFMGISS